uniref:Copper transport protein n=1 Tax=Taeniopygia guttata TaxID=59729 RepID=A0A674HBM0_TAEGU
MQMTFYFSDTVVLLFDFWNVHSPTGMALSVLLILLLAVLYEAVKMGKAVLLRRALLALPRSLSQEALTEPQEGDSDPAQGRYHGTPCTLLWGLWPHGQHKGSRAGTTGPPCTLLPAQGWLCPCGQHTRGAGQVPRDPPAPSCGVCDPMASTQGSRAARRSCRLPGKGGVYSLGRWLQGQPSPSRCSGRCPGWWLEALVPHQEPLWVQEGAAGLGMGTRTNSVPTSLALAVPSFGAKPWIFPLEFNPRSFLRLLLLPALLILEQDFPLSCRL